MNFQKYVKIFSCIVLFISYTIPSSSQYAGALDWKKMDDVYLPVPPKERPRLYLSSKDIPELQSRMNDPVIKQIWEEMVKMGDTEPHKSSISPSSWSYYAEPKGAQIRAELDAIRYLLTGDKKLGRKAIKTALDTLKNTNWPDIRRISVGIGRMMVTGAIVYDWCYPLLTSNEKKEFIAEFLRMAPMLECGYPPDRQGSIGSHTSEFMLMRDLLSVAIAIYDEHPEMYDLTAGRFFREHLPARNWFYPSHAYHQGSFYNDMRLASDLFPLWIYDRMGFGNIYHPSQQFICYQYIYSRRADGQFIPSGDSDYPRGDSASLGLVAMLAASYYKDDYLNNEYMVRPRIKPEDKIYEFLWRDTKLGRRNPSDLPLTKYFGFPFGWMIARTGWDAESVVAEMKVNIYNFSNGHMHLDAGAFQIYYKGPLAIDAGAYSGSSGRWGSTHHKSYHARTIAHNSMLIYDPDEKFGERRDHGNDGGQRLVNDWAEPRNLEILLDPERGNKTGDVLAYGFGPSAREPDYTYLKGDITEAYSSKVKEVKRSFTFLNLKDSKVPAAMIVFDKVVSSSPSTKKFWLLHSIEEPVITENEITIIRSKNDDRGKLINTTLLPSKENADLIPVGGPGKEFWVFGVNYTHDPVTDRDIANERGEWRVELTPKIPAEEDYFLNVMQVMDKDNEKKLDVEMIKGEEIVGVKISDRIAVFSRTFDVLERRFSFSFKGAGTFRILVTDLLPGSWQIWKDNEVFIPSYTVRSDDGVLYFEGTEGSYTFLR